MKQTIQQYLGKGIPFLTTKSRRDTIDGFQALGENYLSNSAQKSSTMNFIYSISLEASSLSLSNKYEDSINGEILSSMKCWIDMGQFF